MLLWHRINSHGLVGTVDSTQQNRWPAWYTQRIEVLWATLNYVHPSAQDIDDRQILFRSRASLNALFAGFDDSCMLVHGNLALSSI